jgi:hypothetical protein
VFEFIDRDETQWEKEPMERLSREGQLMAYRHTDFWQCMDALRDKVLLDSLWQNGGAPWHGFEKSSAGLLPSRHPSVLQSMQIAGTELLGRCTFPSENLGDLYRIVARWCRVLRLGIQQNCGE